MEEKVLEAENLSVIRGGRQVLEGIDFAVGRGEIYALLGGNGAGKSTTLLTFLGFLRPGQGSARVFGIEAHGNSASERQRIAYLPESATLYGHLDAYENLAYFLSLAGVALARDAIDAALDRVSLQVAARSRRLANYSKGMRQKVAIALAMLRAAPVLLLDEPTSGLDPLAIDEFNLLVRSLAEQGATILMVTHDVYGACQVARRVGLLQNGRLVGEFTAEPGQPIDTETVHAAFTGRRVA